MRAYRASEIPEPNGCLRPLVAQYLGYESTPQTKADQDRLDYYSRLEEVVADRMVGNISLEKSGLCKQCCQEFKEERKGFHVELLTDLVRLIGHLDRKVLIPAETEAYEKDYPVEIKNLGRFVFDKWKKNKFAVYPSYAAQECIYLESMQKPGLYIVNNRDTGEMLKYSIPYNGEFLTVEGFEKLELPFTISEVIENVHLIDIYVEAGELPEGKYSDKSDQCRWCKYRFMCVKEEPIEELTVVDSPNLLDAASIYREGHDMEKKGKEMKESATDALLTYSKIIGPGKFKVGGVSVSYRGTKQKPYIDEKLLKELDPVLAEKVTKLSAEYDDYSIRVLKEEK